MAAYSLAAGAVTAMGAVQVSEAAIVYGTLGIDIAQFNSQTVNIDGDAYGDIVFKNYVFGGGNYQGATVSFFPGKLVGFSTGNAYVSALAAGATIDATTAGPSFFGSMAYGASNPNAQFNSVTDAYVGFSFPSGSNLYYAWVRVDVNNAAGTFKLKDFAYNSVSGAGILAGQVPEPGSLALLALGAAGLTFRRRKSA